MQGIANLAGFMRLPQHKDILFVVLENGISPALKKQNKPPFSADFLTQLMTKLEVKASLTETDTIQAHSKITPK